MLLVVDRDVEIPRIDGGITVCARVVILHPRVHDLSQVFVMVGKLPEEPLIGILSWCDVRHRR